MQADPVQTALHLDYGNASSLTISSSDIECINTPADKSPTVLKEDSKVKSWSTMPNVVGNQWAVGGIVDQIKLDQYFAKDTLVVFHSAPISWVPEPRPLNGSVLRVLEMNSVDMTNNDSSWMVRYMTLSSQNSQWDQQTLVFSFDEWDEEVTTNKLVLKPATKQDIEVQRHRIDVLFGLIDEGRPCFIDTIMACAQHGKSYSVTGAVILISVLKLEDTQRMIMDPRVEVKMIDITEHPSYCVNYDAAGNYNFLHVPVLALEYPAKLVQTSPQLLMDYIGPVQESTNKVQESRCARQINQVRAAIKIHKHENRGGILVISNGSNYYRKGRLVKACKRRSTITRAYLMDGHSDRRGRLRLCSSDAYRPSQERARRSEVS